MTVNIIDRYMQAKKVRKADFQLLGISSLLLASKYEEIYPPPLAEYTYVCANAYKDCDLVYMEADILKVLEFDLVFTSTFSLLEAYCYESKNC